MASISMLFGQTDQTDNVDDQRKTVVQNVFLKLRIYLRILGIYFDPCCKSTSPWPVKLMLILSSVMSVFYLMSVWFVQLRLPPIIVGENYVSTGFLQVSLLFFIYLSALWNFSCSMVLVRKHWRKIVRGFVSECTLQEDQYPFILRHFGKFLFLFFLFFLFFLLSSSVPVFSLVGLFKPEGSSPPSDMDLFRLYPAKPNTNFWFIMKCFYAYFAAISYHQAFTFCLFIVIVCYLLKREFQVVTHALDKEHANLHNMKPGILEYLRQKHERLCTLTKAVDSVVSVLVFGIYFTGILNMCFGVSCFTSRLFPRTQIKTLVSVMVTAGVQMLVCMVSGMVLNHEAHRPQDTLMKIKAGELRREDFQSLSVFLGQVSGQEIGITALGLFTINKSTILTIVGTVITYAVVVQQLNSGTEVVGETGGSNVTGVIR